MLIIQRVCTGLANPVPGHHPPAPPQRQPSDSHTLPAPPSPAMLPATPPPRRVCPQSACAAHMPSTQPAAPLLHAVPAPAPAVPLAPSMQPAIAWLPPQHLP
eukprot:1133519-Pelagomonas_calceolata.AAC.6